MSIVAPLRSLFASIALAWAPPPKWTVSQWADSTRKLSSEASAEPGQWKTKRAEYLREILDSISDARVERVAIMSSSQVGKTETILNAIGYYIDYDACPILVLQPTLDMGKAFSKDRLAPMLRDTPQIGNKISKGGKTRDKKNSILHKSFLGGHVTIAGANSPASLASRPIRVLLADEVSRFPRSAGDEGDPLNLAIKRTATFWNKKIVMVSTPTVKGECRIESAFLETDQRYYNIPCPRCHVPHVLRWGNVRWTSGDASTAHFICPTCQGTYTNTEKNAAVKRGKWIATAPFRGRRGYHLWEGYSPWKSIAEVVQDFLDAKDDPSKLQVFVNTSLGETWEGSGESVNETDLMGRVEKYAAEAPSRVLKMTAGVDTQEDRLEVEVVGWGAGEESWSIDYRVIHGDPDIPEGQPGSPWTDLTDHLRRAWRHESGLDMAVDFTCIDSAGHNTTAVYNYCRAHKGRRVYAIVGRAGPNRPIIGAPSRKRSGKVKRKVDLYIVGSDSAKSTIMHRFKIDAPGPGYCHFPEARDSEWFRQVTAEKLVTKHTRGFARKEWQKDPGRRNEALDCRVYAFAALAMAGPQDWGKAAFRIKRKVDALRPGEIPAKAPETPKASPPEVKPTPQAETRRPEEIGPRKPKPPAPPLRRGKRRGGFVNSWR